MIGTKLWFDFSVETKFEASLQGLLREMATEKQRGQRQKLIPRLASKRECMDRNSICFHIVWWAQFKLSLLKSHFDISIETIFLHIDLWSHKWLITW